MASVPLREELDSDDEPDPSPRIRQYLTSQGEEWVVFFRPKSKPLNAVRISADLWKHYLGVTDVTKLHQNKLRVVVNNSKEANAIVVDPRFCVEYRVWIPARSVEIDGVVNEDGLTAQRIREGVGLFRKSNLPTVQVIEVRRMVTSKGTGEHKRFVPSTSFRVTFAGTALPDYLLVDNVLRLPVRLFRPKVMSCTNCLKLGHTKAFCYNKAVCSKCGKKHQEEQCQEESTKCLLCGGTPHEVRSCPKYKEHSDKLKLALKKRSKRSFAEIVKAAAVTTKEENRYGILSTDELDEDDGAKAEEEPVFCPGRRTPKRKVKKPSTEPRKEERIKSTSIPHLQSSVVDNSKFPEFGPGGTSFPAKVVNERSREQEGCIESFPIPFSKIVEMIFSVLSGPTKMFLIPLIPFFKEAGRHLAEKFELSTFISFED